MRNIEAEIHTTMATLLGREPEELCYPKHTHGLSVSQGDSNPALGTLGTSQAEVALATVRLGAGVFSRQEDKRQELTCCIPHWSFSSREEERGTHSRFSFTTEECKAGSPVGREKPPGKTQMVLAPAHVRMCRAR